MNDTNLCAGGRECIWTTRKAENNGMWNPAVVTYSSYELCFFFRVNRINKFHDAVLLLRDIH